MLLNPVICLFLALASLAGGTVALINTDNWLVMLPSAIFVLLFCVSLFGPTERKPAAPDREDVPARTKPSFPLQKLTAEKLRSYAASAHGLSMAGGLGGSNGSGTPAYRT